ncbi:MAG: prepilin-type N-terminal cleavage/methylation domain-containing protein, partial [Actinobacteria bacterium]|nr:prepilin-type N-terminal cleavage/methylation domain-containing protein [Actinomycetota bacterium]
MRVLLKKLFRRDAGFTLTELAVAMVVIGVLASVAVPNFLGARNDSYDHEAQSAVTAALNAADTHYANYGDFSPSTNATCHTSGNTNLVSDLQRLEPNFSFVDDASVSDNPRVVSVDAANSYNSNGEDLGCQVFYATALSRSGTCFVGRLSVEGKYLAADKTYPIVVSSDGSDSNAATNELTGSAQNGR